MCGIAGVYGNRGLGEEDHRALHAMTSILSHRGPDGEGFYETPLIGLGHRRLSIIDLAGGSQPLFNEDRSIAVVFNGEIFNYLELMDSLTKKGHHFSTRSDTEVIVHAYEEYGTDCFSLFNGQWAIALWDTRNQRLVLSRDRIGIRPLFYAPLPEGRLLFASEMKSLFCHPALRPEFDMAGIEQALTIWANIPPTTVFKGVFELPPGSYMVAQNGTVQERKFWSLSFPRPHEYEERSLEYYSQGLRELLHDAVRLRLRADVTVAAYVSGGLDSSVIGSLIRQNNQSDLITFSVAFSDPQFDERMYQRMMVEHLGTDHRMVEATYESIADTFKKVVWFGEKPLVRTAPGPLFLLSRLVRENGIKVVLTGEGADEMLAGYDIFKEAAIRRFWARVPDSHLRPALLTRIYPDIPRDTSAKAFWQNFFRRDLDNTSDPLYSHRIRWANTASVLRYFAPDIRSRLSEETNVWAPLARHLNKEMIQWHPLCQAQYLESSIFLSGYLLSSQGDRMMMGNSVEGRFPFLDYRVMEFCSEIPVRYKLNGLNEKYLLKKTFEELIPTGIINRPKQPYRAPIARCFYDSKRNRLADILSQESVKNAGLLDPTALAVLTGKMQTNQGRLSERENMAIVAMASLQWLHRLFIERQHPFAAAHTVEE